jgi:uncharacterized membrane protein YjgN (DUF898 family)
MDMMTAAVPHDRAVRFSGTWQEFLPIALVNLLLTIVTLGIYRFWAQARVRRYLWSRTTLIDDELEWTGTGGEMFIGFLMVMGVLIGSMIVIVGGAMLLGNWFMMVGLFAFYIFLLWAVNFAQFRALRYRLSRTYWRGIRGGSDENGVYYGWAALGRFFIAGLTLGIMTPMAVVENWNDRMNAMWFGPHKFQSMVTTEGLYPRWLMVYGAYILFFVAGTFAEEESPQTLVWVAMTAGGVIVAGALIAFWALFFRKIAAEFELAGLSASFEVSALEWVKFYATIIALTVVTLGFGALMWRYWSWKFAMDRLALYGTIDLDTLTQSTTAAPRDAEGFADAFDIGAF